MSKVYFGWQQIVLYDANYALVWSTRGAVQIARLLNDSLVMHWTSISFCQSTPKSSVPTPARAHGCIHQKYNRLFRVTWLPKASNYTAERCPHWACSAFAAGSSGYQQQEHLPASQVDTSSFYLHWSPLPQLAMLGGIVSLKGRESKLFIIFCLILVSLLFICKYPASR